MAESQEHSTDNKTAAQSLWKRIPHHKERCESETEVALRRGRQLLVDLNVQDHYSQVRSQYEEPPENGADSYYTPNILTVQATNEDPAFRNVLQMLKDNVNGEAEYGERLDTFGPEAEPRENAFSKQKGRPAMKNQRVAALSNKVVSLREYLLAARRQLWEDYTTFKQLYEQIVSTLSPNCLPIPSSTSEPSICESVRVDISYNTNNQLKQSRLFGMQNTEACGQNSKDVEMLRLVNSLKAQIVSKDRQILKLEEKILQESIKHSVRCERLEKENEQLNMELQEVVVRIEQERKLLRSRHQQHAISIKSNEDLQSNAQLKQQLQAKEQTIGQLRAELTQQYSTIQAFITCIRQLEASAADSVSSSVLAQKELDISELTMRLNNLQNDFDRLEDEHETLKFRNFSTEEENFCLSQRVESFDSEIAEKVHESRKELLKEIKEIRERMEYFQDQSQRLGEQLREQREEREMVQERADRNLKQLNELRERVIDQVDHPKRKSHTEYHDAQYQPRLSSHSRQHNPPLFIEQNNEEELIFQPQHRQTQKSLNRPDLNREMLMEEINIAYETPKYDKSYQPKSNHHSALKTIRYEMDKESLQGDRNKSQYRGPRESLNYKTTQQQNQQQSKLFREGRVSPRSMYYPTPDHSSRLKVSGLMMKPLALAHANGHTDICTTNRTRPLNSSIERQQPRPHRVEISNLEMQLNNLSKELKSEISHIPVRKHK